MRLARNGKLPATKAKVATRDVAVRIESVEMVTYALTAKSLASNTLGYAWLRDSPRSRRAKDVSPLRGWATGLDARLVE